MKPTDQARADAAINSYRNRLQSEVDSTKRIYLADVKYTVFGYANDLITGFHATAYRSVEVPHNIIIAYRGTDTDIVHQMRTTVSDVVADFTMVRDRVNPQKAVADAFTREMLDKAQQQGISKDQITVAGHSLGGALAQIEAAQFGLRGTTFNAYGAVSLSHHVPEGGTQVTNYVLAGDPVSAASRHYGTVVTLASAEDVQALQTARYLGASPGAAPPNPLLAMRLGDHSSAHFTGPQSVLAADRRAQHEQQYARHKAAFDRFRQDFHQDREALSVALRAPGSRDLTSTLTHLPARVRAHLSEYHGQLVDAKLQRVVEHGSLVESAKADIDSAGAMLRSAGDAAQQHAERVAHDTQAAGQLMQQLGDALGRHLDDLPLRPFVAMGVLPDPKVSGAMAHLGAEGLAQVSHVTGQTSHAAAHFASDLTQDAKHVLEDSAYWIGRGVTYVVRDAEMGLVDGTEMAHHVYQEASAKVQALQSQAEQSYDTLTHSLQRFQHSAPAASRHPASTHVNTSTTPPPAMDRRMGEHAPPAHVAAAPPKAVQAPPLTPSPEYLAASAAIQRVTAAIENGDRETLRKEGEAFTNSPHGQAIMAQARALVEREEQERARQQAQRPPRDPREAGHPDHALYQSIRTQVETLHTRNGICPSNKTLDHLTASVALHARENGWTRVDQVHFNADNSVIVAERKSDGFDAMPRFSSTHIQQAMQTPPEQAYQQMAAETQRQADVTQMVQQQMAQSRQGPSLGR